MKFSRQSRREMMLNSIRAAAGLTLAGGCRPLSFEESKGKGFSDGFKIGICDWSVEDNGAIGAGGSEAVGSGRCSGRLRDGG